MRRILLALGILLACSASARAAVTVDTHKDCSFATSPNTCSYTITSATILVCGTFVSNSDTITGVTWNGASLTQVATNNDGSANFYLFVKVSPATGTHNVVSTASGSASVGLACVSYDGTATSSIPEASNTAIDSSGTSSTLSVAVTVSTANAWVVTYGTTHDITGTPTGTGAIAHTYSTANTFEFLGDTGAQTAGSVTTGISTNGGGNSKLGLVTASIQPSGGASTPGCKNGLLMNGVGCLAR